MTETQINHRKPLAPGEIRSHVVGDRGFLVMHTGNGVFAQASYRDGVDGPSRVLATDRFADVAVRAYADAIEQAESDAIDELDDADGPSFTAAGAFIPAVPVESDADLSFNLPLGADPRLVFGEADEPEVSAAELLAIVRDGLRRHVLGGGEQFLDRYLAQTAVELAELLDAYGEAMARGGIELASGRTVLEGIASAVSHTIRADELKAEILARFGGER